MDADSDPIRRGSDVSGEWRLGTISAPLASTEPEEDLSAWQVEMIACLADQGWEAAGDGQNGSVSPRADLTGDDSVQYGVAAEECIERLAPPN